MLSRANNNNNNKDNNVVYFYIYIFLNLLINHDLHLKVIFSYHFF